MKAPDDNDVVRERGRAALDPAANVIPYPGGGGGAVMPSQADEPLTVPIRGWLGDEDEADAPDPMLIDGMLPVGVVAFLAGEPKLGKSWIALYLAICVAAGQKAFKRLGVLQGRVVIIAEEDTQKEIRKRLWWLARGAGVDPRDLPIHVAVAKGIRLDDEAMMVKLTAECAGAALVVLDALARLHGADENDRTAMRVVTVALQRFAAATKATTLTVHHFRKRGQGDDKIRPGQRMRGTGDLHALARAVVGIDRLGEAIQISPESNYGEPVDPFCVALSFDVRTDGKRVARIEWAGSALGKDAAAALLAIRGGATSVDAVRSSMGVGKAKAARAVEELVERGVVDRDPLRVRGEEGEE